MAHAFGRRLGVRHADRSRSPLGAFLLALLLGALPTIAVGQSLDGVNGPASDDERVRMEKEYERVLRPVEDPSG